MSETAQFDYAKLPDGSYAKFPKGTSPEVMRQKLTTAGLLKAQAAPASAPATDTVQQKPFGERVLDVIGQGIESTMDLPTRLMNRGRELFKQAPDVRGKLMAPLRTENEELTNALKGIYQSSAPGMIGQPPENIVANAIMMMAGAGEGGEPVRGIEEAAAKPIATTLDKGVQTPVRVALQRLGGAGKEPVLLENIRRKATETERASDFTKRQADVARENQERLGEHAASMDIAKQSHEKAVADAEAKYQKAAEDYRNSTEQTKAAYADKVRKARAEWVQKSAEARQGQAESARVSSQRQTLQRGQETYASKLQHNLQRTFQTVKGRLNARWHHLRETPIEGGTRLKDAPLNSVRIANAIENAKEKYLVGAPESLKQFNDLMGWMTDSEKQIDQAGGPQAALKPISWDDARTHYSALGDKMYSGELPGNVLRAVRSVRDALDSELSSTAAKHGQGQTYSALKSDWSNFESDWKDMSSVTTKGGSPLARARMAPNAATLAPQLTGKTGDLVLQRLAKYKDAGASIPLAEGVRKLGSQLEELPRGVRVPKAPSRLEIPPEPQAGEPPELKVPEFKPPRAPEMRTAKPPEPVPPIDPVAIRRKLLTQYASRPISWWDILPPRVFERPLMSMKAIRDWVAKQPRKELEP